ncbi:hypothetical protein [Streptomyces roseolilacinus]|uniref:Uncharacterized protein n=1 Tax=Streptomyces roseolilacinus TaxID=66904 RepID=A0A918EPL1_9ACTN|nr:hypothetical protein [Streptomyces roseolilacinus]GGQ34226.1 hypothetical protein GCM10010249_60710 [Streptomyces roseolilacinus]
MDHANDEYEVVLRSRPGGPAILGAWSRPETADRRFMEWLGRYGTPGVVLTLTATVDGETYPVRRWTYDSGLQEFTAI